ncbi:MAG: chorismate mutase [Oscillospiraceae bacterium]|jgi:chorismate mutase/prephenate dehydratase|nr:chorismate mutase [Oscillospiraceae bacterium]
MTINELRTQIDAADGELAALFVRRMELAHQIAITKRGGTPILDSGREAQVRTQFLAKIPAELGQYAHFLLDTLFSLSRSYQRNLLLAEKPQGATVACQGTDGAFSHAACLALFNEPNILFFRNFAGVFSSVEQGLCQYGILPVENSTAGAVEQVRELMGQYRFRVVRAISLHVRHCLLGKPGTRPEDVHEVLSHEQALGQCGAFLQTLPGITKNACANTAVAARTVAESERRDWAAIASPDCAKIYGLDVIAKDIQDSNENTTRFLCIERADDGFSIPEVYEEIMVQE